MIAPKANDTRSILFDNISHIMTFQEAKTHNVAGVAESLEAFAKR